MRLPMALAELTRDVALVLDGEIGNAAPRVELIGRRKGLASGRCRGRRGRSRNDRSPAASASISAVVRMVPMKNHEPSSRDTRLVCRPCQPRPGLLRQRLFHQRCGIDEDLHIGRGLARQPLRHALELALHHIMVVAVQRIDRDDAGLPVIEPLPAGPCQARSSAPARSPCGLRATGACGLARRVRCLRHPVHAAMAAFGDEYARAVRRAPDHRQAWRCARPRSLRAVARCLMRWASAGHVQKSRSA